MKVMVTRHRTGTVEHLVLEAPPGATVADALRFFTDDPHGADDPHDRHGDRRVSVDGAPGARAPLLQGVDLSGGRDRHEQVAGSATPEVSATCPWVVVASGPDAGGAAALLPGRWVTVGRDPLCELPVNDPGLSRRHVRIQQERSAVRVEDLGSTNGIGWEQGSGTGTWRAGDRLLIGGSSLVLLARTAAPASTVLTEGSLEVVPWPRAQPASVGMTLCTPTAPSPRRVRRPSSWSWALPLVLAVAVAALLRMPWLMLFGLLGPAMVLGAHLGDRRSAREEYAEASLLHGRACDELASAVAREARADLVSRRRRDPGLVGVVTSLLPRVSATLWECVGGRPRVVLGEGVAASSLTLDDGPVIHQAAPIALDLDGPLVLAGAPAVRDGLARSLVLQLVSRYPPSELAVMVDPAHPPSPGWDLLAWLPHTTLDDARAVEHPLRWGQDLVLLDDPAQAPGDLTRVLVHGPRQAVLQRPGRPDLPFCPTTLSLPRARDLARRLAPLQVGTGTDRPAAYSGSRGGPHRVTALGDLLAWPSTPTAALAGWRTPGLVVPLGTGPDGTPLSVDLARDGPHALVAGTTGSGKSELLRTLVVGLALRSSPADLALLLVDYKGGASLGDCAGLPHVAGLVTDLDPHLAERVLASLQAELRRREKVLHAAGARDVRDHRGDGLPKLVVVVDEFRVLAEEVPEVMDGLVRVAAVGRSLGVHLVLATQRPAGVVGADLRANVNLRIALRVRDVADSHDVLECPDAAQLPEGRPGLALLRTGADPPRAVHVAVAAPPSHSGLTAEWSARRFQDVWQARAELDRRSETPTSDLVRGVTELVPVLSSAAGQAGLRAPVVWLPPLPDRMVQDPVTQDPGHPAAWAVADLPGEQRREQLTWSAQGHLAVVGSARSGRSTALRSLLHGAGPVWTVVLDLGRSLGGTALANRPGRCAWAEPDDLAHGIRVLDRVLEVVLARQADPGADHAPLVVVLDGWDRFVDLFGQLDQGRAVEVALRILREGPAVGVVAAITGDRTLLLGRIAALLPETWALRLNDPSDLLMTGLRPRQLPRDQPPGRLVRVRDGVVAQVLLPPGRLSATDDGLSPDHRDHAPHRPAGPPPLTCVALPRRYAPAEGDASPAGRDTWAVGGDEALPLRAPAGSVLVLGPPGSGKSQAVTALVRARGGAALTVRGTDPPDEHRLRTALGDLATDDLVVVDDAHLLSDTDVEPLLCAHLSARRATMIVSADLDTAAGIFRGLVPQVARSRTAVILQARSPAQGTLVGMSLPVGDLLVPGRGVLVARGRCTRIQVVASAAP